MGGQRRRPVSTGYLPKGGVPAAIASNQRFSDRAATVEPAPPVSPGVAGVPDARERVRVLGLPVESAVRLALLGSAAGLLVDVVQTVTR